MNEEKGDLRWGRVFWTIIVVAVFATLLSVAMTGTVWGLRVLTSDVRGRGDVIIEKNDATNRIGAQENFEQMFTDLKAYRNQIATAQKAAEDYRARNEGKADSLGTIANEDARLSSIVTGLANNCQSLVADYNAASNKITQADWRRADLPKEVSAAEYCTIPTNSQ